jgi:hypothetical protein
MGGIPWGQSPEAFKTIAQGLLWAAMISGVITRVTREWEGTGNSKVLKRVKLWHGTAEFLRLRYDYDADGDNITIEAEAIT